MRPVGAELRGAPGSLDALLEEGSVAGAAALLRVTAPAMSRSLGRMRRTTGG